MLLKARRAVFARDSGGFIARPNMPGWLMPRPTDHGLGPLAMVVESMLVPGRLIAHHEHRNDEIISWVPEGVMRHQDPVRGELVIDRDHLLVMNAGRSFWHSERTLSTDPPLRMLQIMVRPREADLEPVIQFGRLDPAPANAWRHLSGPEGSPAPFFVRSAIDLYDIRLEAGAKGTFPMQPGRMLYFYVFSGAIEAGGHRFGEAEQGLYSRDRPVEFIAAFDAVVVAFLVDLRAGVAKCGTVGDIAGIPSPRWVPALRAMTSIGLLQAVFAVRRGFRRFGGNT